MLMAVARGWSPTNALIAVKADAPRDPGDTADLADPGLDPGKVVVDPRDDLHRGGVHELRPGALGLDRLAQQGKKKGFLHRTELDRDFSAMSSR
jgi:hypothetical protein